MFEERSITEEDIEDILKEWPDADLSIVESIIFYDGWFDYEEYGGYLIFRGIDGTIQCSYFGYSVMCPKVISRWNPVEISEEEAQEYINEIIGD